MIPDPPRAEAGEASPGGDPPPPPPAERPGAPEPVGPTAGAAGPTVPPTAPGAPGALPGREADQSGEFEPAVHGAPPESAPDPAHVPPALAEEGPPTGTKPPTPETDFAPAPPAAPPVGPSNSSYLLRHWRGELSLPVSYWVNGIGAKLLMMLMGGISFGLLYVTLQWAAALTLIFFALIILLLTWLQVGIWRSASRHASRGGSPAWAVMAKGAVVLGAILNLAAVVNSYLPQSTEMVRIMTGDKGMPAYVITVLPGGTEIEFRGGLRAGSTKALRKVLAATPGAKVLHIESVGGRIAEGRAMRDLIRERGLTTYTAERCLSAATLALVGGKERVVGTGAKVGFHAGRLPGATAVQRTIMDSIVRSTLESAGISDSFIRHVLETPSQDMWYPTYEEMRAAGVVTTQSAGDRFASAWNVADPEFKDLFKTLEGSPCYQTIKRVDPLAYRKMITNFVAAIRAGKTEGEAIAAVAETSAAMMRTYLPSASDEALLAMRDLWIDILTQYKDGSSPGCIAFFTQAKVNLARLLPGWNMTNSLLVVEKVISSGATKVHVPVEVGSALADLHGAQGKLAEKYGEDVKLLGTPKEWPAHSQRVCDMLLDLYRQMAALPDHRSANVLRYLTMFEDPSPP